MLPTPAPIYLDYHATTPVDRRVASAMLYTMTTAYGNPNSSEHIHGEVAASLVADARREVADLVDAHPEGVHFTSGASDGIRLAVAHAVAERGSSPLRIAVTTVEHRAVLDAVAVYERAGMVTLRWLPVDNQAHLDMAALETACVEGIDLVCVMAANNEVGTLYPVERIALIAAQAGARTLIDATQAIGHVPVQVNAWGITYLTISAHKIYGPKGIGALVTSHGIEVRKSHSPTPGTDDGTPNVPGIVGLGEACRLRRLEMGEDEPRIVVQRDRLESLLLSSVDRLIVNGDSKCRLGNNLHVSIADVPNDAVLARLRRRVAISTGAACASGAQAPSHVLQAMGLPEPIIDGALRIGMGKFTTEDEIEHAAEYITEAVAATRRVMARPKA